MWILQIIVWVTITWETSTMVVESREYMWGSIRLTERTWFERQSSLPVLLQDTVRGIFFVCYEGSGVHVTPNITQSSDDRRRDSLSVDHLRETHGNLQETHGTYSCSPSLPPCCVVRCFEGSMTCFCKIMVRNRKKIHFFPKRWGLLFGIKNSNGIVCSMDLWVM